MWDEVGDEPVGDWRDPFDDQNAWEDALAMYNVWGGTPYDYYHGDTHFDWTPPDPFADWVVDDDTEEVESDQSDFGDNIGDIGTDLVDSGLFPDAITADLTDTSFDSTHVEWTPKYHVGSMWNYDGANAKFKIKKVPTHERGTYKYLLLKQGSLVAPETHKVSERTSIGG